MAFIPLTISHYTTSSALGLGNDSLLNAIENGHTGLSTQRFAGCNLNTFTGIINEIDSISLPGEFTDFNCRNNRLSYLALQQDDFIDKVNELKSRFDPSRIGVFLGTSTSGIQETEMAYQHYSDNNSFPEDFCYMKTHNTYSFVDLVQQILGLSGPAHAVSTACSSSAKTFASASRYVSTGLCDAAIVGGVDSLCLTTLYGFNSLELISEDICRPWDSKRNGINIGEGAGFAILEKPSTFNGQEISLRGYGESSDAYHMSSPHPQGLGAIKAMSKALDCLATPVDAVDYINLHGTATQSNDNAEDKAVSTLLGNKIACSSTKGMTGHTLGAAGIIGVLTACVAIKNDILPCNLNLQEKDPALTANILSENQYSPVRNALVNSFGFGGSNCSLLIGKMS